MSSCVLTFGNLRDNIVTKYSSIVVLLKFFNTLLVNLCTNTSFLIEKNCLGYFDLNHLIQIGSNNRNKIGYSLLYIC